MSQDFFSHLQKAQAAIKAVEFGPAVPELARAPEIDLWLPVLHHLGAPCLWGQVRDHPILGGDDIMTSPVVALNVEEGWARSCSRWYRLGRPFFRLRDAIAAELSEMNPANLDLLFEFPGAHPIGDLDIAQQMIADFVALVREQICGQQDGCGSADR